MVNLKQLSTSQVTNTIKSQIGSLFYNTNTKLLFYSNGISANQILSLDIDNKACINSINPTSQMEINNATGNCLRLIYNNSTGNGTNFVDFTVSNSGNLNILSSGLTTNIDSSNNFNISSHNGSTAGLELAGILVTASAVQLNYLKIAEVGVASANTAVVLDSNANFSGINTLSVSNLLVNGVSISNVVNNQYININTEGIAQSSKALVVDSNINISNINILSANTLTGTISSSSQPNITSLGTLTNLNMSGAISGVTTLTATTLAGILSTSFQPNITDVGTLTSLTVSGITTLSPPLPATSGGTGNSTYVVGQILVADSTTTLTSLSIPSSSNGTMLITSDTSPIGLEYSNSIYINYVNFGCPTYISNSSYIFHYYYGRNSTNTNNIIINNNKTINISTTGINGITQTSINLTGTIFPDPSTSIITGTGTTFTTDLMINDIITVGVESRKINAINSSTSITIDSPFTLLNTWTLDGTAALSTDFFKYGTQSLYSNAKTAYATLTLGSSKTINTSSAWTVEFFLNIEATNATLAVCSSTTTNTLFISFVSNNDTLTISLGQGGSYNIANADVITSTIVANTWYHLAIVFTGAAYIVYLDGVQTYSKTSSLAITSTAFNTFRLGGNTSVKYNGYIDIFRLSNISRYTSTFTPPTSIFTLDNNTLALNSFESITITSSDLTGQNVNYSFNRGGVLYKNSVYYAYALNHSTNPCYIFSTRYGINNLIDLPSGYYNTDCRSVGFSIPISITGTPYSVLYNSINNYSILPVFSLITTSSLITSTAYDISKIVPKICNSITISVILTKIGNSATSVIIGPNPTLTQAVLPVTTPNIYSLIITIPILPSLLLYAHLSSTSSTTTFSVNIISYTINNNY